ncbi:CIC11C00000005663 [Sungouiella intermedia]|uniref:CIC11C00000005663 n=1 Tax=Sungouiella intermedia TaxID=45354 RepID=A0A1L0BY81_9ASCO|nr:CIC11C00000005663 [[Candida] intermedia]
MDLSKLSSDLPPTKSLEQISVSTVNKELTDEFKNAAKSVASLYNASGNGAEKHAKAEFANAAKSVASLYRLASNSNTLLMDKGYLECLDDLLEVIANNDDIENWALTRRAEVTNHYKKDRDHVSASSDPVDTVDAADSAVPESADLVLPTEYEFMAPQELNSNMRFRPSLAPFSVNYKRPKKVDRTKRSLAQSQENSGSSDVESDVAESEDVEMKKRRAFQSLHDVTKRRRREPPSDND